MVGGVFDMLRRRSTRKSNSFCCVSRTGRVSDPAEENTSTTTGVYNPLTDKQMSVVDASPAEFLASEHERPVGEVHDSKSDSSSTDEKQPRSRRVPTADAARRVLFRDQEDEARSRFRDETKEESSVTVPRSVTAPIKSTSTGGGYLQKRALATARPAPNTSRKPLQPEGLVRKLSMEAEARRLADV
eukprot:TRINITY_DN5332_c0_g1_i1.p1 TRINITY_DN5332_c0_g1~~TRINITY_DN5332_c0_g1_i1.p1  ORF type:complete len:187 (+),score=18.60 TRINITY_DN5332_c0_g1_i1:102-662(+)